MIKDLYCRLYVNHADERLLLDQVAEILDGSKHGRAAFNDTIDFSWSRNVVETSDNKPDFVSHPSTLEANPRSKFTGINRSEEPQEFLGYLVRAIVGLRNLGHEVVASCEYEDLIAAETG